MHVLHGAAHYHLFRLCAAAMKKLGKVAPWPDFLGHEIREGDVIIHPSGEFGIVRWAEAAEVEDQWLVQYAEHSQRNMSRLCLQIGDKGQAVVRQPHECPTKAALKKEGLL